MEYESFRAKNGLPCSFCRDAKHQKSKCNEYRLARAQTTKFFEERIEPTEEESYKPILDVTKDPGCYRAVLSAYGKGLSGKKDGNIENLKELAGILERTLVFHKVSIHD